VGKHRLAGGFCFVGQRALTAAHVPPPLREGAVPFTSPGGGEDLSPLLTFPPAPRAIAVLSLRFSDSLMYSRSAHRFFAPQFCPEVSSVCRRPRRLWLRRQERCWAASALCRPAQRHAAFPPAPSVFGAEVSMEPTHHVLLWFAASEALCSSRLSVLLELACTTK